MTATGAVLVQHRSINLKPTSQQLIKRHRRQVNPIPPRRCYSIIHMDNLTMSKALIHELDLKMQQVKEYGLIAHGYHNENFQYPVHVRRSHDGEKVPRSLPPILDKHHRINRFTNTAILTSSLHENQTSQSKRKNSLKKKQTFEDQQQEQLQRTFAAPPNKTVNDIDPSLDRDHLYTTGKSLTRFYNHRKSSSSSANSSPILCSLRPHSIACLSRTESITTESCETIKTDEQQVNPLSNSSQSLVNQSTSRTPIRTITQKFFSRLFHNPSKT
ncbi:unnamed protein product [Rotaria socialis]|uniref:Uncharacterized protein n=2 Tax=Rotaria socialis TaxID=392032 RepID=A0A817RJV3_9BILA|nr:unnamed protein product [Rotaria socialis]CAF3279119.1 unnamed protein product [Rotaria socialis]CAF3410227.1 unnamed protein product [Rotaria socialis]CAF3649343.1 unnamed protein product [Rotaria socialis]CAF3757167.1 unnamed protein product [Rotaria socialis]